jgi:type IV pilus assembly protein PilM
MNALEPVLKRVRAFDPAALLDLRPAYPPIAVEVDRGQLTLVRVKKSGGRAALEAYRVQAMPEHAVGQSIFRPNLGSLDEMAGHVRELFEKSGTKPGRVSIVLPDNLAKSSIVTLPERPANRRQLEDLLRFKLKRSVPFRLEDAAISSWPLSTGGPGVDLLVSVMLRSVVEQYEAAFETAGARPGLVDLCTPSIFNLVRHEVRKAASGGSDVAVVNCARTYFTLMIARADRVVFTRCKSYAVGEDDPEARTAVLARELASSLSYYQDKLSGAGVATAFVRSAAQPFDEVAAVVEKLGAITVRPIDPASAFEAGAKSRLDAADAQRLAPAIGAAAGRAA